MKKLTSALLIVALCAGMFTFTSCESDEEKFEKEMEKAAAEFEKGLDKAAEEVGKEMDKEAKKLQDSANED